MISAQVGINTQSPKGAFHVNGKSNDLSNTNPSDDFIVSNETGNVGIGLDNPTVKLDIKTAGTSTTPIPGLKLADGNEGSGKVLYSDENGVATWQDIKLFTGTQKVGAFSWAQNTAINNTNWNKIASVEVPPGTYMVYLKVHMLSTPNSGFVRTYVGTKDIGTDNEDPDDTPILGSSNFQPYNQRDFEITQSFVYTNSSNSNKMLYFNLQSDSNAVKRSKYTNSVSFLGVNLTENYFLAIPTN